MHDKGLARANDAFVVQNNNLKPRKGVIVN
jgi:hypothetical protein